MRLPGMDTEYTLGRGLVAEVELEAQCLRVCLRDARSDVLAAFVELTPQQQQQLAIEGWTIGVRALLNVQAQAQQAQLADIGKALMTDVEAQANRQLESTERMIHEALRRYFDPRDGHIAERLGAFLNDNGVLEGTLRRFIGADNSVLAQTLARAVGETSPLFKMLSPTDNEGVVQLLQERVTEALAEHRGEVDRALDPLHKEGAVARFLEQLRDELGTVDKDRDAQITRLVAALDANDEASLFSRMVRETREAQLAFQRAINLQQPDSPLATVKRTLEELLCERMQSQQEQLKVMHQTIETLQAEMRDAVTRIETRRTENARSTRGGNDFEHAALAHVQQMVPAGACTFEHTGNTVGARPNCKVGDGVARFTEESAYAGSAVVIEVKRDASYSVPQALSELETACANRNASVGLFVMARSHAAPGFPNFARYGSKLLVTWDADDASTDGLLHGATVAALALAQRKQSSVNTGDLTALSDVEQRLIKELERIGKMDVFASNIARDAKKITDELRKAHDALERIARDAQSTLTALNIEVRDEEAERAHPIVIGGRAA